MRLSNIALAVTALYPRTFMPGYSLALDFTSGNKVLDPRITFSRTTNATVTGGNGLIQNAPMNLLTFSEQFDNAAWGKQGVTITANATTSPNGTTTAELMTATASSAIVFNAAGYTASTAAHTSSIYIKANSASSVRLDLVAAGYSAGASCFFNVVNGTKGNVTHYGASTGFTADIVSIGDGWFRASISGVLTAAAWYTQTFLFNSIGSSVYIWGAQLELGSTATTYNPTTVKNLLGYTEHFDNAAWTKSNATITSGFTDIYGQPFAQKLVVASVSSEHSVGQAISTLSGTVTFSCFMKQGEWRYGFLRTKDSGGTYRNVIFDLADGSAVLTDTGWSNVGSVSLGNGWYRCYGTITITVVTNFATIGATNSASAISVVGDGTSGIYIFGAQLSDSASVDPYVYNPVAAPTSTAYYGPRFDYDPVTLAPNGLLIEEQRTNLLTYSEDFSNAIWAKGASVTLSSNTVLSPAGTLTADVISTATGADTSGNRVSSISAAVTGSVTSSIYLRADTPQTVRIKLYDNGGGAVLTTTDVAVTTTWKRFTISGTVTIANTGISVGPAGTAALSNVNIWGAQLEAGAFATSYIPTVASQVTRAADNPSMLGNNFARWYNATQGTLFAQFDTPAAGNRPVLSVGDGTANNMIQLRTEATDPYFRVTTGGVAQVGLDVGTVAANTTYKMTGAYEANNFSACINAGTVGSDTSGTIPVVTRMLLGSDQAGSYLNGHISRVAAYGRVLAATEQQGVTA